MTPAHPLPGAIAVSGGGIAGLAAAHRFVELDPGCNVTLFEAGQRLGGVSPPSTKTAFQIDRAPDNFHHHRPLGVDLCKRLGLADQLVQTNPANRRTFGRAPWAVVPAARRFPDDGPHPASGPWR